MSCPLVYGLAAVLASASLSFLGGLELGRQQGLEAAEAALVCPKGMPQLSRRVQGRWVAYWRAKG